VAALVYQGREGRKVGVGERKKRHGGEDLLNKADPPNKQAILHMTLTRAS
jgi:hypothetical protein